MIATKPLLSLKDIHKTYQIGHTPIEVLKDIDFDIHPGEYVAIMGPSGSGKSTMLNILGLLDVPDKGSYHLNDREVANLGDHDLAAVRNKEIGFIFQSFNLFPQYDVLSNIMVPMLYARMSRQERQDRAEALAERVGLSHRLYNRPSQLSGGEMQRVAIARALSIDPPLILADEPTGNLDQQRGEEILDIFDGLIDAGKTIIMVTHNSEYQSRVQKVLKMRDGCLVV